MSWFSVAIASAVLYSSLSNIIPLSKALSILETLSLFKLLLEVFEVLKWVISFWTSSVSNLLSFFAISKASAWSDMAIFLYPKNAISLSAVFLTVSKVAPKISFVLSLDNKVANSLSAVFFSKSVVE